jgi:hypothetical protein
MARSIGRGYGGGGIRNLVKGKEISCNYYSIRQNFHLDRGEGDNTSCKGRGRECRVIYTWCYHARSMTFEGVIAIGELPQKSIEICKYFFTVNYTVKIATVILTKIV